MKEIPKSTAQWLGLILALFAVLGSAFAFTKYIVSSETSDLRNDLASIHDDIAKVKAENDKTNKRIDDALTNALNSSFILTRTEPVLSLGNTILQATSINFSTVSPRS